MQDEDAPEVCEKCGKPHWRNGRPTCRAHHRHPTYGPCGKYPQKGFNVCHLHGARSPQAVLGAQKRLAEATLKRTLLKIVDENTPLLEDPIATLRMIGGRLDAWVQWLTEEVERSGIVTTDQMGVERITPQAELLRHYLSELRKISTDMARLGLEERQTAAVELSASAEWAKVRAIIVSALAPYPEAMAALARALREEAPGVAV